MQGKMYGQASSPAFAGEELRLLLLSCERKAVRTLVYSGIGLVSAHLDRTQRAIVLQIAVMGTLADSTFDRLVCLAVHNLNLPFWFATLVWLARHKTLLFLCSKK